jgi:hypothetical protein
MRLAVIKKGEGGTSSRHGKIKNKYIILVKNFKE